MFKRLIASFVCFTFIASTCPVFAQDFSVSQLPVPGTMVSVSPNFEPALIKGLTVHKDNPFLFDFIVDPGKSKLSQEDLKAESDRMIKYFFAALTIPDKDIWVNLSPYEKDRMVPASLGVTAMGRDLLAQDYMLKQLTASLIYPQKDLGKTFWTKVYAKAKEMYGTAQVPVNTFNKVWIVPQRVGVYEHGQTALIVDGHLKVMLEEDYLASTKHNAVTNTSTVSQTKQSQVNQLGSQIIRQIVLPEIEKEVNEGKNFATLRQIFYSQALAVWFKHNLKQALLNRVYANKGTVKGIDQNNPATNDAIYQQYLKAYKKGVFNYIKEDIDPVTQENLPRKYFSGGWDGAMMANAIQPVELSPSAVGDVAVEASRYQTVTVLADTNESDARALTRNVDAEFAGVGGIDLKGIKLTTSGPEAAAFLKGLGIPVSVSNDPHVIIIAGQSIDLSQPETFGQAFERELQEVGALDPKDMTPEDKAMLGDLQSWFNVVLGVHFAGIATLSAAIVKSTHEFYKGKNATTMEVKREYYKRFRKDWMHIAGAATIVVTGVVLGAMHGINIDSIKLDLLAILTGSKIGGGIFGFEKMADELVAASNATDNVNDPKLKAVENFEGNSPRKFFFNYTDWPVMIALFAIAYTKFPASWNPTVLQHVIDYVNKVPHLGWILPVVPVLMGVGIGATLATQVDKNRPTKDAAMTIGNAEIGASPNDKIIRELQEYMNTHSYDKERIAVMLEYALARIERNNFAKTIESSVAKSISLDRNREDKRESEVVKQEKAIHLVSYRLKAKYNLTGWAENILYKFMSTGAIPDQLEREAWFKANRVVTGEPLQKLLQEAVDLLGPYGQAAEKSLKQVDSFQKRITSDEKFRMPLQEFKKDLDENPEAYIAYSPTSMEQPIGGPAKGDYYVSYNEILLELGRIFDETGYSFEQLPQVIAFLSHLAKEKRSIWQGMRFVNEVAENKEFHQIQFDRFAPYFIRIIQNSASKYTLRGGIRAPRIGEGIKSSLPSEESLVERVKTSTRVIAEGIQNGTEKDLYPVIVRGRIFYPYLKFIKAPLVRIKERQHPTITSERVQAISAKLLGKQFVISDKTPRSDWKSSIGIMIYNGFITTGKRIIEPEQSFFTEDFESAGGVIQFEVSNVESGDKEQHIVSMTENQFLDYVDLLLGHDTEFAEAFVAGAEKEDLQVAKPAMENKQPEQKKDILRITIKANDISKAASRVRVKVADPTSEILYRAEGLSFSEAKDILKNGIDTSKISIYWGAFDNPVHAFKQLHFQNMNGYKAKIDSKDTVNLPADPQADGGVFLIALDAKGGPWFTGSDPYPAEMKMVNHYQISPKEIVKLYLFNPESKRFEEFKSDEAMTASEDHAALANAPNQSAWVQGGIDLSDQDAAMRVTKDANGGVSVNVDQALIARIEREGMPEVHPVIINMQPANMKSLFGVEALVK